MTTSMKKTSLGLGLGLCIVASAALADRAAGDKCATSLPTDARTIYAASAAQVAPGADLRGIITAQTKALVQQGALSAGGARSAAEAAGKCLMMVAN